MKRVLVTGATGFAGKYLCEALARDGFKVTGTSHSSHHRMSTVIYKLISIDLTSQSAVLRFIQNLKPDYVIHLAAQTSPRHSWQAQEKTLEANVGATLNLLRALHLYSPKTRMLYVSSIHVYGRFLNEGKLIRENSAIWPESPYASSKAIAELACLNFFIRFGLQVVIARAVNHTGAGQDTRFVFSDWCRQIALAEKKKRPGRLEVGNLDVKRDFLHVRDVVKAYRMLLFKGKAGTIYNVASSKPVLLRRYADFLQRCARISFKITPQKNRMRCSEAKTVRIDSSRLRALGWRPRWNTYQALEELLNDWRRKVHG